MSKSLEKFGKAAYIILYLLCCSMMSSNKLNSLWGTAGYTLFIYFKLILVFCVMFTATLCIKEYADFIGKTIMFCTAGVGILFGIDYYTLKISGTIFLYSVWWIAAIVMSALGVFVACALSIKKKEYPLLFKRFVYGITPLYAITVIICFLRIPANNLSTNFIPLAGTFQMLKAFLKNPSGDFEAPLLFFGNIFIFTPLPIIIKGYFPKLKNKNMLLIGILTPFFVEGYQYIFKCGDVDIDDLITNFIGFMIGLGIYKLIEKKKLKA